MAQYDIVIKKIDLDLLKKQKKALLGLVLDEERDSELYGLINLIDHIQDQAIEQHGLNENEVFDFNE